MEFIERIPGNRVRCTLTYHEMPDISDVIEKYMNGSRFQNAYKLHEIMRKFGSHFDDNGPFYVCKLTNRTVAKSAVSLENHVNGRRFRKALERFEAGEFANPAVTKSSAPPNNEILLEDDNQCSDSIESGSSENSLESDDDSEQLPRKTIAANLRSDDAYDFNAMETDDMPTVTSSKRKLDINGQQQSTKSKKPRKS